VMALPRALRNALTFRKLTGTSLADLMKEGLSMRKNQDLTWAQVAMAANSAMMTKAAMVDGKPEVGILPTGQAVGVIEELPTVHDLISRVMAEADATLTRLGA